MPEWDYVFLTPRLPQEVSISVSLMKDFIVIQTINLKQGVIGADAAAVVHDLQTSEQDKIFQAKSRMLVLQEIFQTLHFYDLRSKDY